MGRMSRRLCLSGLLWLGLCSCLAVTPIQPPPVCHDEMVAELTAANMWRPPEPNRESGVIAALPPTPQEERAELAPVAGADGSKVSTPDVIQALPPRAKEAPPESPAIFVYEGSLQPKPSATLRTSTAHRLLAIDPHEVPHKVSMPGAYASCGPLVSTLHICVSETGAIRSLQILRRSIPVLDRQLPAVIARWRYRPYLVDGQPTPFCYMLRYNVVGSADDPPE